MTIGAIQYVVAMNLCRSDGMNTMIVIMENVLMITNGLTDFLDCSLTDGMVKIFGIVATM
ncbi:hypothetical protein [Sporomusa silvacetica]|uniref:hypothetical protein n=1 Tax=Sporomusa silvacetica TaxID=55504 RepID=UPI0035A13859